MDDALLVSRAAAGDLDSFGQLYDRYFGRVYDFAWRTLRNAEDAADVTGDVFLRAMQGLPGLSRATSFESWLFTLAHNTAVARAERVARTVPLPAPVHEEAFGTFDVPDPCRLDDPGLVAGDHEVAALVWEAAAALNPRDYALLDLHVRQGLASADIADVIGVSRGNAQTMVSRMESAAADVIGSYVVARRGAKECEQLQAVLAAFEFPPYTDEVRKAVDAHIKQCEICQGSRRALVAPLEIFGALAAVAAPMALKGDIWRGIAGAWGTRGAPVAGAGALAGAGAPVVGAGAFGPPLAAAGIGRGGGGGYDSAILPMSGVDDGAGWNRQKVVWFAGAVVGLLVFALAGGALIASSFGGGGGSGGGASGTPSATRTQGALRTSTSIGPGRGGAAGTLTPGVAIQTATPNLTPPATPQPTDTPTLEPPPAPTDTPIAVKTVTPTPPKQTPTKVASSTATLRGGATPTPTCPPSGCLPGR